MTSTQRAIQLIKKFIVPPMNPSFHKGQAGRIAVLGGSEEYAGAPFYASDSSLKAGSDLSYVISTKSSAVPIKSYSPEIIVFPYVYESDESQQQENFDEMVDTSVKKIEGLLSRLHVLVIGPGMSRNKGVLSVASRIIATARQQEIPLIIDGDGLYLVSQDLNLVKGYKHAVLLPNVVEYKRIYEAVFKEEKDQQKINDKQALENLCKALGNVTIVMKGVEDMISNGNETLICSEQGSPRRSGGQGDILSGITATFVHWAHWAQERFKDDPELSKEKIEDLILCACYSACVLTRKCANYAFKKYFRSTTAPSLLEQLPCVLQDTFPYREE
jgi:ATP-dependent NAD(P)H-hydrate dehydratase